MLRVDPRLAEAPGCSTEQLESLARNIEHKKLRLEADINAYITQKQHELARFQQQLVQQYREMECGASRTDDGSQASSTYVDAISASSLPSSETSSESKREEKAKRTKVHKREKELFGLVTPIFLPLLDASDAPKDGEKKKRPKKRDGSERGSPEQERPKPSIDHARQRTESQGSLEKMDLDPPMKENQTPESVKKSKRPAIKKSSLRNSGEKRRRKRVSLVIDGQTVLPADHVPEPQLMSPQSETASTASSITSLEDTIIDPRLLGGPSSESPLHSPNDPVHHNLSLPSHLPSSSPTKHTGHTLPDSPFSQSPPSSAHLEYEPPLHPTTRTYFSASPPSSSPALIIPQHASAAPIYACSPTLVAEPEDFTAATADAANDNDEFSTYVGGISGSGVDDLDQTGSLGYPSSIGASYMESYMAGRPLSVRMAAAEKAGLRGEERRRLLDGGDRDRDGDARLPEEEDEDGGGGDRREGGGRRKDGHQRVGGGGDEDVDMDIIGSMEGF